MPKITFQPSGKSIEAPAGTLLLDAAAKAGLLIDTPCGGQGRCGRCLVRVESGEVSHRENPHLSAKQLQEGWVLACVARVAGDLSLNVPPRKEREKVVEERAGTRTATALKYEWPRYPAVRQIYVELTPPTLEDAFTDVDRLQRVLSQEHSIEQLYVELPVLQRLASTLRQSAWKVTLTLDADSRLGEARLIDIQPGKPKGPLLAIALDIGTTNVVMDLVDLRSGRAIERVSERNRQIARGEDVISRIVYSEKGGLGELQHLVVDAINNLVKELSQKHSFDTRQVYQMVVASNTTMTHLFLGMPPKSIREEPYVPTANQFPVLTAAQLGVDINPLASIYNLPAVAAYVGGDITAGVLAACLFNTDRLTLFLDVGTNGEIVLGNKDWMTTCACSAGPAFEGAGVRHGMRATTGAIEEVRISNKTLGPSLHTIGDVPPLGICGSGMITALAEMLVTGVIDRSGHMKTSYVQEVMGDRSRVRKGDHGAEYVLAWAAESGNGQDIVLTEVDINNLIRTKAAIYAGMAVMARNLGINLSDIEEVLIGGAFGQHIDIEEAIQIGLLPDLPWDRFKFLGNTSLWGAYNVLLSKYAREKADEMAGKMTYLELIADNSFMNELMAAMFLPHTDIDQFPTVKAALEKAATR
ncbi:MAG: DUF4445 domain-containing protein [Chloroflexi bacterium]|nr:DUF4445 domain-containing protein [Chloroflexota bacterium]